MPPQLQLGEIEASAIRKARESLMSSLLDGARQPYVSERIERSWRRSIVNNIEVGSAIRLPEPDDFDPESALLRAGRPVLDRLAAQVDGLPVCVMLADDKSRIIVRRVGDVALGVHLDRVHAVEGSPYAEDAVGTNGIGTALLDGGPVIVRGSEHYVDFLQGMTCAGFPIRNSITGRSVGAVVVACRSADAHDLMAVLAAEAAGDVEARLIDTASRREQALLRSFLDRSRRSDRAVVVLNEDLILSNSRAAALLGPSDHALLWEFASGGPGPAGRGLVVELAGGQFSASVDEVTCDRSLAGFYVRLNKADGPRVRRGTRFRPPGRSPVWAHLSETLERAGNVASLAIVGGPGSGKLYLARQLHALRAGAPEFQLLDSEVLRRQDSTTVAGELAGARALLGRGGTVLWRHVERADDAGLQAAADLVARAGDFGQLILTSSSVADRRPDALLAELPVVVDVPDLCVRTEDIPDLVRALLSRHGFSDRSLSAQALQVLVRSDWPGNVAELEQVLVRTAQSASGASAIGLEHLPEAYAKGAHNRPLTTMERLERTAIVETLRLTNGNRKATAELLGIGRTTLYRKLRALNITEGSALLSAPEDYGSR